MSIPILIFWAVVMLTIQALSGKVAAIWFAVGWLGASTVAIWEAGGRERKR